MQRLRTLLYASLVLALAVVAVPVAADATASQAGSRSVRRCTMLRASVPYRHDGNRYRWGVYATGSTSCQSAERTLDAVMHLRARAHNGSDTATSYFSYHGWRCDFGQMGSQACWTPAHRPYRAAAVAMACDRHLGATGCPAAVPRDYLP